MLAFYFTTVPSTLEYLHSRLHRLADLNPTAGHTLLLMWHDLELELDPFEPSVDVENGSKLEKPRETLQPKEPRFQQLRTLLALVTPAVLPAPLPRITHFE